MREGLPKRLARHTALGQAVRAGLSVYGFRPLAVEGSQAPTLTCFLYPEGLDDLSFRQALAAKGVVIAGALATLAGKACRMGHMGNVTGEMFTKAIRIMGETLQGMGLAADINGAVKAFEEVYGDNV